MPRKVSLRSINAEVSLRNTGITIYVQDDPATNGRLRIGRLIRWTNAGKGEKPYPPKTWDELVNFMRS